MTILKHREYADTVISVYPGPGRITVKSSADLFPVIRKAMISLSETTGLEILITDDICASMGLPPNHEVTVVAWKTLGSGFSLESGLELANEIADKLRIFSSVRVDS